MSLTRDILTTKEPSKSLETPVFRSGDRMDLTKRTKSGPHSVIRDFTRKIPNVHKFGPLVNWRQTNMVAIVDKTRREDPVARRGITEGQPNGTMTKKLDGNKVGTTEQLQKARQDGVRTNVQVHFSREEGHQTIRTFDRHVKTCRTRSPSGWVTANKRAQKRTRPGVQRGKQGPTFAQRRTQRNSVPTLDLWLNF